MTFEREPRTVDDGIPHRPRSTILRLSFLLLLIGLLPSACLDRREITLALLGDLNLARGVEPQADSLDYLLPELSSADLALANLESPLANISPDGQTGPGYNLCSPAQRAELLPVWGLDMLALANNHRLDCGPEGDHETLSIVSRQGLTPIGPGMQAVYTRIDGLELALLAFDDVSTRLDGEAAARSIRSAWETGALVIVSVHWGTEYQGGASERQQELAQKFSRAGAALIWGHHPHVLQPAEWIEARPGEGSPPQPASRTLVLYSLGNALFDQGGLADTRRSALVLVTLGLDGVQAVQAVPFEIDVVGNRLVAPQAETAEKIRSRLNLP